MRTGFSKCAAATLACPMCGAASFSLILLPGRMQPYQDAVPTAMPTSRDPEPLLPCRTLRVFACARVCANACPAPALPKAR